MTHTPTPTDLGRVITNARARAIIYATYVIGVVIIGATQVAYAALDYGQPAWLTAAISVAAFLGAPIGALAAINTSKTPSE